MPSRSKLAVSGATAEHVRGDLLQRIAQEYLPREQHIVDDRAVHEPRAAHLLLLTPAYELGEQANLFEVLAQAVQVLV